MRQAQQDTEADGPDTPQPAFRTHDSWEAIVREELRRMRRHATRGSSLLTGGSAGAQPGREIRTA